MRGVAHLCSECVCGRACQSARVQEFCGQGRIDAEDAAAFGQAHLWRRHIGEMDAHTPKGEPSTPAPKELAIPALNELAGYSAEEVGLILVKAARSAQAAAVPGLEQLATGDDLRLARAAVQALGEVRDESAVRVLTEIRESAQDKAVRKEAGRSLHRLRSAGVYVAEELTPVRERVPAIAAPPGRVEGAFAGYYDWTGTRLLATHVWAPGEGRAFIAWLLKEDEGIDDCRVFRGSKRKLHEVASDLVGETKLTEIDTEHARFLMKEAGEIGRRVGREMPHGYSLYSAAVKNLPPPPARPIIYEKMDADDVRRDVAALRDSGRLLSLRSACSWAFAEEKAKPYWARALAIADSVIYTSEAVQSERLRAVVEDAMQALFTPDVAQKYQRRLEETAYLLLLKGREKPARSAFAAAIAIADGKPPRDIPFVEALVATSIGVVLDGAPEARRLRGAQAEAERDEGGRRLIVTPAFGGATTAGAAGETLDVGREDDWRASWRGRDRDEDWDEAEEMDEASPDEDVVTGGGEGRGVGRSIIIDPRDLR